MKLLYIFFKIGNTKNMKKLRLRKYKGANRMREKLFKEKEEIKRELRKLIESEEEFNISFHGVFSVFLGKSKLKKRKNDLISFNYCLGINLKDIKSLKVDITKVLNYYEVIYILKLTDQSSLILRNYD